MRANRSRRMTMILFFGTILGMAVWAPWAAAADSQRGMKWQFSVPITFTSGGSFSADAGTSVDINDDLGWGFGFGYHFNERLLLGAEFTWIEANYDVELATDINGDQIPDQLVTVSGTLDASNFQIVGQYNFLEKSFTPFVRANFGSTWIDSNIPAGPPVGTCWWDPWWGYICGSWQPTFEDSSFSYGAAAGVRADLTPQFFIEGSYNMLWIDFDNDTASFDGIRVNLGWTF